MYGAVRNGNGIWRKICRNQAKNSLYYVIPELDEQIFSGARKHMKYYGLNMDITIVCTKDSFANGFGTVRNVTLDDRQMEYLLAYLRSCRDTMLNLNFDNVFVLSFKEVGGNSLQKLYEEKIYENDFLINRWLLPDLDNPDRWRV